MPHLAEQDGHQVYYHLQGTLNGDTPILFLHGGPGAACQKSDHELLKEKTEELENLIKNS